MNYIAIGVLSFVTGFVTVAAVGDGCGDNLPPVPRTAAPSDARVDCGIVTTPSAECGIVTTPE